MPKTELYNLLRTLDYHKVDDEHDKRDLLMLFISTGNDMMRDRIAMILSDIKYEPAIPYFFDKIEQIRHNCGAIVAGLGNFDLKDFFLNIVHIVCHHDYEPRLWAYGILEDTLPRVDKQVKLHAIDILEKRRIELEKLFVDTGEDSALYFVKKSKEKLLSSIPSD
jgi:hypothetical protein